LPAALYFFVSGSEEAGSVDLSRRDAAQEEDDAEGRANLELFALLFFETPSWCRAGVSSDCSQLFDIPRDSNSYVFSGDWRAVCSFLTSREGQDMAQRTFVTLLAAAAMLMFGAGSAGQSAWADSALTAPATHSYGVPSGLSGTWHGTFQEIAAPNREVQGRITIRINDDGTFTATSPTRPQVSGTVAAQGNRVIFQSLKGARMTLMRSGNTLYGLSEDQATEALVTLRLEKV
jgi:hypothetical protein